MVDEKVDIIWIGISPKKNTQPLSEKSKTGEIIKNIEDVSIKINTYKTNLVKSVPTDINGKLRYPNRKEIDLDFEILVKEIDDYKPKIIFLLGKLVASSFEKKFETSLYYWEDLTYNVKMINNVYYVPIHHPSYINIYKKNRKNEYIKNVQKIITTLLES